MNGSKNADHRKSPDQGISPEVCVEVDRVIPGMVTKSRKMMLWRRLFVRWLKLLTTDDDIRERFISKYDGVFVQKHPTPPIYYTPAV
jgi:hypothetical protein